MPRHRAFRDSGLRPTACPSPEFHAPVPVLSRSSLPIAAAAFLAAVIAAPVAAVAPGGASDETVTGVFEAIAVDTPGGGPDRFEYTVRHGHDVTRVAFDAGDPQAFAGATVSVTGNRRGGTTLHARSARPGTDVRVRRPATAAALGAWAAETGSLEATGGSATASEVQAATAKTLAVVMFNFSDLRTTPYTKAQLQDAVFNSASSVKGFYEEESKGRLHDHGHRVRLVPDRRQHGELRLEHLAHARRGTPPRPRACNLSGYTNVMFVVPSTSACGWAGVGYVPGPLQLHQRHAQRPGDDPRAGPQLRPRPRERR